MANNPDLDRLSPSDLFQPAFLGEYDRQRKAVWDNLVRLHNNLSIMEDITFFPGRTVLGAKRRVFDWLGINTFEFSIVIAWRLWEDRDRRAVTLPRLGRDVVRNAPGQYQSALRARLKAAKPADSVRAILQRATAIRHGRLAHLDERYHFDETARVVGISLPELRTVCSALERFYNALGFGQTAFFSLSEFERDEGRRSVTEGTLEAAALDGPWNTKYDKHGPARWWRGYGSKLSPEAIDWLNHARQRHGQSPIDDDDR